MTESGWTDAFEAFAHLEPEAAAKTLSRARSEVFGEQWRQRATGALGLMPGSLFLGGHGVALNPGLAYDLLFDQEGLVVAEYYAPMVQNVTMRSSASISLAEGKSRAAEDSSVEASASKEPSLESQSLRS